MSKMTNLKKGVVGVCAATMLAGMCAVPAFANVASGETSTEGGGLGTEGTAQSQVSLSKADVTAQISATVPTTLPVAVSDAGFTPPTGATITNTSPNYGIVVKSVGVTKDNSNLTLVESTKASKRRNRAHAGQHRCCRYLARVDIADCDEADNIQHRFAESRTHRGRGFRALRAAGARIVVAGDAFVCG